MRDPSSFIYDSVYVWLSWGHFVMKYKKGSNGEMKARNFYIRLHPPRHPSHIILPSWPFVSPHSLAFVAYPNYSWEKMYSKHEPQPVLWLNLENCLFHQLLSFLHTQRMFHLYERKWNQRHYLAPRYSTRDEDMYERKTKCSPLNIRPPGHHHVSEAGLSLR